MPAGLRQYVLCVLWVLLFASLTRAKAHWDLSGFEALPVSPLAHRARECVHDETCGVMPAVNLVHFATDEAESLAAVVVRMPIIVSDKMEAWLQTTRNERRYHDPRVLAVHDTRLRCFVHGVELPWRPEFMTGVDCQHHWSKVADMHGSNGVTASTVVCGALPTAWLCSGHAIITIALLDVDDNDDSNETVTTGPQTHTGVHDAHANILTAYVGRVEWHSRQCGEAHEDPSVPPLKLLQVLTPEAADAVVIDIGAWHGGTALRLAASFPGQRVFALEPHPDNFGKLVASTRAHRDIVPLRVAVTDEDGPVTFYENLASQTHSLLPLNTTTAADWRSPDDRAAGKPSWMRAVGSLTVRGQRLDTLLDELGVDSVDFIKVDAQGGDLAVLRGIGDRLRDICAVQVEVQVAAALYVGAGTKAEVMQHMTSQGFELQRVDVVNFADMEQDLTFRRVRRVDRFGHRCREVERPADTKLDGKAENVFLWQTGGLQDRTLLL